MEVVDLFRRQGDRQTAILEAVVKKDVREGTRNHRPDTVVGQGPDRMLSAGTVSEILPGDQNRGPRELGPIQFELGIRTTIREEPPIKKKILPEAGPLDPLEKLLGNDLVGVDIGAIHRRDEASVNGKRLHALYPFC